MKQFGYAVVLGMCVVSAGCGGKQDRVAQHLEKGKAFFAQEDFDKARVEIKNVLQMDPKNVGGYFMLGQLAEKQENWGQAVGTYQRVIELDANNIDAKTRLARIYLLGGAVEKAETMIGDVLKATPQNADALAVRAGILMRKNDYAGAEQQAKAALAARPGHIDAVMLLAGLYKTTQRMDDAVALLNENLARNEKSIALRALLAEMYAERNDTENAIATLRQIIAAEPGKLGYRVELANYLARNKRADEGEALLREAAQHDAGNAEPKLALITFLAVQRGQDVAQQQLDRFIQEQPKLYPLSFALARVHESGGRIDDAQRVLGGIINSDGIGPDGLRARSALAVLKAKHGDANGALTLVHEVLKESPKDNDALLIRATLALDRRDAQSAIGDLRTVLKDQPSAPRVVRMLASAHVLNNEPELARDYLQKGVEANPQDRDLRYDYAGFLLQAGDAGQAAEQYQSLVKQAPDNGAYADGLFKAQAAKGDWAAARAVAKQLTAAYPEHALGYYLTGLVEQQEKNYAASLKEFETALKKNAGAAEPLSALVKSYLALKQPEKAQARLREVVQAKSENALAHSLLGEVLVLQKNMAAAQSEFQSALRLNPKSVLPYRDLAALRLAQGNIEGAVQTYREGLNATDNDPVLAIALAGLYERKGDYDQAIAIYDEMMKRDPTSQVAMNNLAMVLSTYKSDAASLDRAKDLAARLKAGGNPAYLDTVAWVHYKRSEFDLAVPVLEQALRAAPGEPLLHYHLGMVLYKKGDAARAKDNLRQAVDAKVNFAGLDEARATLAKL